jgi:hypothetical protein
LSPRRRLRTSAGHRSQSMAAGPPCNPNSLRCVGSHRQILRVN